MERVLVVTGGSRGIGAAAAKIGARDGYKVAVNYNASPDRAEAVVAEIRAAGGTAVAIQADVSTEEGATRLFAETDRQLGTLTALFNNAGIAMLAKPIEDYAVGELEQMWRVNITSQFLCAREAIRRMSTKHGGRGGAIVNMSSAAARLGGIGNQLAYGASKGAIDTFTHGLALEVAPYGIRVNGVRPGIIDTEIHDVMGVPDRVKKIGPTVPMGRAGSAEEVAETVIWLLSDRASYVTMSTLDISGGR
ncbi:MAG: SDR family oxidoreductase [Hyphomicrobiaceae bacterium]